MKIHLITRLFFISLFIILLAMQCDVGSERWKPAPAPLMTKWGEKVSPGYVWPEYPRPQMVRGEWINLNGIWEFTFSPKMTIPDTFGRKILVPFPVESALSGIGESVSPDQAVWYRKEIRIPESWGDGRVLMHFEACDWETMVYIDKRNAGKHKGGYDPFSFDITALVKPGEAQEFLIRAWDPTDEGLQPRGKQVLQPEGIFYTATTGIWQTIWLEPVPESYISNIEMIPDVDNAKIYIKPEVAHRYRKDSIEVEIVDGRNSYISRAEAGKIIEIYIPEPKLWSPSDPHLYNLTMKLLRDNEVLDRIESYTGMRKVSIGRDKQGFTRIFINNEFIFQNGPLDQGFWPDGLYTPPSDAAMQYDLQMIKKMGFNMLRKHVKVENRRFYYWCDKIGLLVWQDMPSCSGSVASGQPDLERPQEAKNQFEFELNRLIKTKMNHPCIIMWVPFNEGWGQYETGKIVNYINILDPTRLVNNASGWQDRGLGDVIDLHHYPEPICPAPEENRANVLGEFGGLGLFTEGYTWEEKNWGYQTFSNVEELASTYRTFYEMIWSMVDTCGLSAAVYTQVTDVETETNGLMTYDREVVKIDLDELHQINSKKAE